MNYYTVTMSEIRGIQKFERVLFQKLLFLPVFRIFHCKSEVPLNSKYITVENGSCESNGYEMVESKDECGQAATDLGDLGNLGDYTRVIEDKSDYWPHGCLYLDLGLTETESLWFLVMSLNSILMV